HAHRVGTGRGGVVAHAGPAVAAGVQRAHRTVGAHGDDGGALGDRGGTGAHRAGHQRVVAGLGGGGRLHRGMVVVHGFLRGRGERERERGGAGEAEVTDGGAGDGVTHGGPPVGGTAGGRNVRPGPGPVNGAAQQGGGQGAV